MESRPQKPADPSRREFLKKLGVMTAALVIGKEVIDAVQEDETPKSPADNKPPELPKPAPETVPEQKASLETSTEAVDEDIAVLENRDYEKFFSRPYLVYALYYSDNGMREMKELKDKTPQQEKIAKLHELVTPELRQGYIEYLDGLCAVDAVVTDAEVPPLEDLGISAQLDTNHLDAIDLFTEEGSVVESFTEGVVVLAENTWNKDDILSTSSARGGNTVIIYNAQKKEFYRYAHLKDVSLQAGTIIQANERIALVGNTGLNASKPGHGRHLHFEINAYDPETKSMTALSVYELKARLLKARSKGN